LLETVYNVAAFERLILTKLEVLKQATADVKKSQQLLMAKVDSLLHTGDEAGDLPDGIDFPLTTVRSMQSFSEKVAADAQLKQLVVRKSL